MLDSKERRIGFAYAMAAFIFWGLNPIYFKAVGQASPLEVLGHRILWSVPFLAVLIFISKGWKDLWRAIHSKKVILTLLLTSILVASNWLVFIYAIGINKVLHCSLGYYFNPLFNVVLGYIFLGERLNRLQAVAVLMGVAGTVNLTIHYGELPWISLFLPLSFGIYGLLRKTVAIESLPGLFVETALLLPAALIYLIHQEATLGLVFGHQGMRITILLLAAGAVTSLPLVWFTAGARRMRYTTIGLCQYVAPSLSFILAVAIFGEAFTQAHMVTFALIWTGLGIFMFDALRGSRA